MRKILTISIPEETARYIEEEVERGGFATTSEFIRHIIRLWKLQKYATGFKKQRPTKKTVGN